MQEVIIDWEESTKIAGNNLEAAKEFLLLLSKSLPQDLSKIQLAFEGNNKEAMRKHVHSLHGALCYCSVPRLKNATFLLEKALQNQVDDVSDLFHEFKKELFKVIEKIQE